MGPKGVDYGTWCDVLAAHLYGDDVAQVPRELARIASGDAPYQQQIFRFVAGREERLIALRREMPGESGRDVGGDCHFDPHKSLENEDASEAASDEADAMTVMGIDGSPVPATGLVISPTELLPAAITPATLSHVPAEADGAQALHVARDLIEMGLPLFAAKPDVRSGLWKSDGGTGGAAGRGLGYWLPSRWQDTVADLRWLDPAAPGFGDRAWRPGYALCMVTGAGLDVLDTDPHNGGDLSRNDLLAQSLWPLDVLGLATTPSGGTHEFIPTLGMNTKNNFRPGLDFKGGTPQRDGSGFVFLSPTIKLSKVTGRPAPYAWVAVPDEVSISDPDSHLDLRRLVSTTTPRTTSKTNRSATSTIPSWITTEDAPPCRKVINVDQAFVDDLASGDRHPRLVSHLRQLMTLRQRGHRGVAGAIKTARSTFADAADRPTIKEADNEFDQVLSSSITQDPKPFAACTCDIEDYKRAVEAGDHLSRGRARTTEVKIMRHLLMRVEQTRSWLIIGESQRTIGQSIDVHQPTVATALKRLIAHGWLMTSGPRTQRSYRLRQPAALTELSIDGPQTAGHSIDHSVRASVHPLFGTGGLSGSVVDTFACLAERSRPYAKGKLVRVRPGSRSSTQLTNPYQGRRQIPRSMPDGHGRAAGNIAEQLSRHPSTIRKHLKILEKEGLAFSQDGLWWRLRFDPVVVLDDLAIVDTATDKTREYLRQRRNYRMGRVQDDVDADGKARFSKVIDEQGHALYIQLGTGQVVWRDPEPEAVDP